MKLWKDMTQEERQERLGDPTICRKTQGRELDVECVRRLLTKQPMSRDMKKRARAAIRAALNG